MTSAAMSLQAAGRLDGLQRACSLLHGLGYFSLVGVALAACWSIQGTAWDVLVMDVSLDGPGMLRDFFEGTLDLLAGMLPAAPVSVVLMNVAPPAGWRRAAVLALAAIAMASACQGYLLLIHGAPFSPSDAAGSLLMASLVITACVYRGAARDAADTLLRRQIESATLDAEMKQARLRMLRAQMEPHFLFNTLATVRSLARSDRQAAVEMIDNLMRYLAEALPRMRQDECPLAQELQLIDAYLRIHQVRMGPRLAYDFDVPSDLASERVPTMMLLTLVENALKHAVNPQVEGGCIRISAAREQSTLVLKVADTGSGLGQQQGRGMGLANVRLRLMMLYGHEAILSLAPSEPRGVVATIALPHRINA